MYYNKTDLVVRKSMKWNAFLKTGWCRHNHEQIIIQMASFVLTAGGSSSSLSSSSVSTGAVWLLWLWFRGFGPFSSEVMALFLAFAFASPPSSSSSSRSKCSISTLNYRTNFLSTEQVDFKSKKNLFCSHFTQQLLHLCPQAHCKNRCNV